MEFNPAQWAREHEALDHQRFGEIHRIQSGILKVLGVAGTVLITVLGWSLKAQYDGMAQASTSAQAQLTALERLNARVDTAIKSQ